jgi:hypothetical protein
MDLKLERSKKMKIELKKENYNLLEKELTQAQKRARVRTIDAEKLFDINDEAAKKSWDSYYYEVPMDFENDGYEHSTSFVVVKNGHLTDAGRTSDWRYRL